MRERITSYSGLAAMVLAVFGVGGALRGVQALVALIAAIAIGSTALSRSTTERIPPLLVVLRVAALFTLLQLIPLPSSVTSALDPVGSALRGDGSELLGVADWGCLSRDPAGSLRALIYLITLDALATVGIRMSVSEQGRYRILSAVALTTFAVALVVAIHVVVGAHSLYGFYKPHHATPYITGPLLNENHLGSLATLGALVALGLAAYPRQATWKRVGWLVCAAASAGVTAASSSRGATLALFAGGCVVAGLLVAQRFAPMEGRSRRGSAITRSLPAVVVAVCAVILVVYATAGRVQQQFATTSLRDVEHPTSKYAAWRGAEHLVEESPWVGVGRGGFESSFTRVYAASGLVTFSHVENEYLQAVVDWGIPAAIVLGLACAWLGVVMVRRWRNNALAAGAIAAVVAVAIQSVVDFGVELFGIAIPLVAVISTVTYVPIEKLESRRRRLQVIVRASTAAILVVGAMLLMLPVTSTLDEDHQRIAHTTDIEEVRQVLVRHPHDYLAYATAARLMSKAGDRRAVELLNHAMRLHPTHPGLHLIAARALRQSRHMDQAAIEYESAMRATVDRRPLLREIVSAFSVDRAVAAIPLDAPQPEDIVTALVELKKPEIAIAWLRKMRELHPTDVRSCELLYKLALDHGDLQAAETAGRQCVQLVPDRQTRFALARIVYNRQGYAEVINILDDVPTWTGRIDDKVDAWVLLCDSHKQLGNAEAAIRCYRRLDAAGIARDERAASLAERIRDLTALPAPSSTNSGSAPSSPPAGSASPH